MAQAQAHTHEEPNYMAVFLWLFVLTVVEIGVVYLPLARALIAILLVGLAVTKAIIVAMYFMHLKYETSTLGIIAAVPMLLCVLLVFAMMPDHLAIGREVTHKIAQEAEAVIGHH